MSPETKRTPKFASKRCSGSGNPAIPARSRLSSRYSPNKTAAVREHGCSGFSSELGVWFALPGELVAPEYVASFNVSFDFHCLSPFQKCPQTPKLKHRKYHLPDTP